jgi:hypothetical protein
MHEQINIMKDLKTGSVAYHCDDSQCDDKDDKKFDNGLKIYSKTVVYRLTANS